MAKIYFLIALGIAILQIIQATDPTRGTLLYSRDIRSTKNVDEFGEQCPTNAQGPICTNDCKTVMTCAAGNLLHAAKCADITNGYRYCVPNTYGCTDKPDLTYDSCAPRIEPRKEFTCTNEGYFPSPHNCTEYFFCTPDSVHKYSCPPNYQYNPHTKQCHEHDELCTPIDCDEKPNTYVTHATDSAYYAFCSHRDDISEIIMFHCDLADISHMFNVKKISCEFKCRTEGWFEHESNPEEYYECYMDEDQLVHRIQACPEGYHFNGIEKACSSCDGSLQCDGRQV